MWLRAGGLVLVVVLLAGLYSLETARRSAAGGRADIAVTIIPTPNVGVQAGSIVSYQVRVKNFNDSTASRVLVHMPYDPQQLEVLDAAFTGTEDWVNAVGRDFVGITFGDVGGRQTRTATVRMRVAEHLPQGTVINMWAGYGWDDGGGGDSDRSANAAPLVVTDTDVSSGATWMQVEPAQGQAGTVYGFFSNRFAPGERVLFWLETPYGTEALNAERYADAQGRVWFEFDSSGFPAGSYELVMRSQRTEQIAVAPFSIQ
jgi:hypothetical protein